MGITHTRDWGTRAVQRAPRGLRARHPETVSMGTFTKPLAAGGPGRAGGEEEERLVMCSVTTVGLGWKLFLIYSPLVQTFY